MARPSRVTRRSTDGKSGDTTTDTSSMNSTTNKRKALRDIANNVPTHNEDSEPAKLTKKKRSCVINSTKQYDEEQLHFPHNDIDEDDQSDSDFDDGVKKKKNKKQKNHSRNDPKKAKTKKPKKKVTLQETNNTTLNEDEGDDDISDNTDIVKDESIPQERGSRLVERLFQNSNDWRIMGAVDY